MEIKTNVKGVDKYITIVGMLSSKLLNNEPFCSLQPKCLMVYAYLLYYRNDVYGHLQEDIADKLTFTGDLQSLTHQAGTGLAARTATGAWATRTLTSSNCGLS